MMGCEVNEASQRPNDFLREKRREREAFKGTLPGIFDTGSASGAAITKLGSTLRSGRPPTPRVGPSRLEIEEGRTSTSFHANGHR